MSRRLFLKGLAGLFVAPAIVKADNLMKIVVPRTDIILPEEFNPLHFGNMRWKPELLMVLPTTRNSKDIRVQPMFREIISQPMMMDLLTVRDRY